MKNSKEKISIHLSYLLRHAPEAAQLDMDRHGWVSVAQLIDNVNESGKALLSEKLLQEIVATDNKGRYRFSSDGKRIKACQGHSIPWVEPELEVRTPPEFLYHGTTTEALADIMKSGAIRGFPHCAYEEHFSGIQEWLIAISFTAMGIFLLLLYFCVG